MIGRDSLLEILQQAVHKAEGDEVELVAVVGRQELSRCANSVIHQNVSATDAVLAARVVQGKRVGCATANGITVESGSRALREALELSRFAPVTEDFQGLAESVAVPTVASFVPETAAVTPEARAISLKGVFEAASRHDLTVAGSYGTYVQELAVVNSRGVAAYAPLSSGSVNLVALGKESSGYACGLSRDVRELNFEELGERAIAKCLAGNDPVDVDPGDYEVILEPSAVAELMEWMTYTCFGARSVHEKTSALVGHWNEQLFGENISIYDDATESSGLATPFDFEGQPKRRLDIVKQGRPRSFGTDTAWAGRLNTENTSHALLRSGEDVDPIPMNLFIEAGTTPTADLVKTVERGLLVTRFHYVNGFLDTRRALMTGMTRDGTFLIENGKIGRGVGNLRFTQSMVDAFSRVKAISREREAIPCWWSPLANTGAFTMPTLHIDGFHFSGRTGS